MVNKNPYQVICIGNDCNLFEKCRKNECILKNSLKSRIKGCNYANNGDCKYCSHKNKCILIRPYSDKLHNLEVKRIGLETENKRLYEYLTTWNKVEDELDGVGSVTDVVYFDRNKQQMIDRINDNNKLIKAYREKEDSLIH